MEPTEKHAWPGYTDHPDLASYYSDVTSIMLDFGGDGLIWHYGLWGPDTKNHDEALDRSNRTLAQGCELGPGQRALDSGCGIGGFAIWLAKEFGVHATGLNIFEPHVQLATKFAHERDLEHLVDFRQGDFMKMPFPDSAFDAVFNQESFCYVSDHFDYLTEVYRVLKPGGRWQTMDFFLTPGPLTEEQESYHRGLQHGFLIPPLPTVQGVVAKLEEVGFEQVRAADYSTEIRPSAEWYRQVAMTREFLRSHLGSRSSPSHQAYVGAADFCNGLDAGAFVSGFVSAVKPG